MSDASDSQPPVERTQPAEGLPQPQPPLAQSPWPYPQQQGGFPQQGFPQQGAPQQGPPQGFPQQGFPQQAAPPASPFPQQAYAPPQAEPDWAAMAQEQERSSTRRKRAYLIGGGILGAGALAGIVLTTMALTGDKHSPGPSPTATTATKTPSPKPTEPKTPLDIISSTTTDTSPVTIASLYPAPKITVQGREYVLTAHDTEPGCTKALSADLAATLKAKGCSAVYRVTYVSGQTEVTVGVATFRNAAAATSAKAAKGNVAPLVAGKVTPFCQNVACRTTQNSLGRYVYFTIAGPGDGKPAPDTDQNALQAGRDIADSVHDTLMERGRAGLAAQSAGTHSASAPASAHASAHAAAPGGAVATPGNKTAPAPSGTAKGAHQ